VKRPALPLTNLLLCDNTGHWRYWHHRSLFLDRLTHSRSDRDLLFLAITLGQEKFRSLTTSYYRDAVAVVRTL
jgi:hypothetical protein